VFWLSDEAWSAIEPLLPSNQPGARRVDDRRIISGIIHVLQSGCRWRDCPSEYGPYTTVYNCFNRWSRRKVWQRIYASLVEAGRIGDTVALDRTHVKAHRSAAGAQKTAKDQAIGLSRGGRTTKLHLIHSFWGGNKGARRPGIASLSMVLIVTLPR